MHTQEFHTRGFLPTMSSKLDNLCKLVQVRSAKRCDAEHDVQEEGIDEYGWSPKKKTERRHIEFDASDDVAEGAFVAGSGETNVSLTIVSVPSNEINGVKIMINGQEVLVDDGGDGDDDGRVAAFPLATPKVLQPKRRCRQLHHTCILHSGLVATMSPRWG